MIETTIDLFNNTLDSIQFRWRKIRGTPKKDLMNLLEVQGESEATRKFYQNELFRCVEVAPDVFLAMLRHRTDNSFSVCVFDWSPSSPEYIAHREDWERAQNRWDDYLDLKEWRMA